MRKPRNRLPQILIILESSVKAIRDKLQGILKYERLYGPWRIHLVEGRSGEQLLEGIRDWGGTGIILEAGYPLRSEIVFRSVLKAKLPTVLLDPNENYLDPRGPFSSFSTVSCDGEEIGRLGAEHFLERHLHHFAFVDEIHQASWSRIRREAFLRRVEENGFSCHVYHPTTDLEKKDWGIEQRSMTDWLASLPKPIGIMAAMDMRARQVLDACNVMGINVPHDAMVLGVDNDELICETTNPPLSSILADGERGGYIAAEILDGLMNGRIRKKRSVTYGVLHVVSRRSSAAVQVSDVVVQRALEYIWINNGIGISVSDIAQKAKVSRRLLEIRFKQVVGHRVIEEIQRVRLERVRTLVLGSDLTFNEIARLCGFESESYLGSIFKRKFRKTMTRFRKDKG